MGLVGPLLARRKDACLAQEFEKRSLAGITSTDDKDAGMVLEEWENMDQEDLLERGGVFPPPDLSRTIDRTDMAARIAMPPSIPHALGSISLFARYGRHLHPSFCHINRPFWQPLPRVVPTFLIRHVIRHDGHAVGTCVFTAKGL